MHVLFALLLCNVVTSTTYNVKSFGAKGDGTTNDRPAFATALATLKSGDILQFPAGTYLLILPSSSLSFGAGITVTGAGPSTIWKLQSDNNTRYTELFRPAGSNILLSNLVIQRSSDFPTVLIPIAGPSPLSNFTLQNVMLVGNRDIYPTAPYAECLRVGDNAISNILVDSCVFKTWDFALFQDNAATATVNGFTVRNSIFSNNYQSDLEFNAPNSVMRNIVVVNSQFSNNQSPGPSAGWAVGFANVQTALVQNNTITNYQTCGVHVEDRSSNILINNNTITNAAQQNDNDIFIINKANGVNVTNNVIDSRGTSRNHYIILATAGGGSFPIPTNVLVSGNILFSSPNSLMWYLQPGTGPSPTLNCLQWEAELTSKTSSVSVVTYSDSRASNHAADLMSATAAVDLSRILLNRSQTERTR